MTPRRLAPRLANFGAWFRRRTAPLFGRRSPALLLRSLRLRLIRWATNPSEELRGVPRKPSTPTFLHPLCPITRPPASTSLRDSGACLTVAFAGRVFLGPGASSSLSHDHSLITGFWKLRCYPISCPQLGRITPTGLLGSGWDPQHPFAVQSVAIGTGTFDVAYDHIPHFALTEKPIQFCHVFSPTLRKRDAPIFHYGTQCLSLAISRNMLVTS